VPWRLTSDVEEYAERTWDLLTESPAEHTIALTVLETVRRGRRWSGEPMLFGWFEDGAEVSGAVFRTPPFNLLLGAVPEDAAAALVATLRAAGVSVPGANGRHLEVERFAEEWTAATGARSETKVRLALYELGTLHPPDPSPAGWARAAETEEDLELAIRWYFDFQVETRSPVTDVTPLVRERMEDRRLWLWEGETGPPVSLAARTPAVAGVARIAPVYTPPEHRRHGYGTAITAACTADALDRGTERVVLFTDLANPTSNAIYQRIGYRPIGERREIVFESTA
jgi:RimJ/RimL family protein N-acetyltransferase